MWNQLGNTLDQILNQPNSNINQSYDNVYFLYYAKRLFLLADSFSELNHISMQLQKMLNMDIESIDAKSVRQFNLYALRITLFHQLILNELYRKKLVSHAQLMVKLSQVSGPWSNVDMPIRERVWRWREEDENWEEQEDLKHESMRYNPEYVDPFGFYFVERDWKREPYKYEDAAEESNYPSSSHGRIP